MNINSINAGSSLNRPQVPRSVSFGGAEVPLTEAAEQTAQTAKKGMGKTFKAIGEHIANFFTKTVPDFFTKTVPQFFMETVPNFFRGIAAHFKKAPEEVPEQVEKAVDTARNAVKDKKLGERISQASKALKESASKKLHSAGEAISKFAAEHKSAKGVKLAATVLTAVVAGGFAIKEIYDIATKSNPER